MATVWIILVAAAALAALFWWWRRYRGLRDDWERERQAAADAKDQCAQIRADNQAQVAALLDSMSEGVLVLDTTHRIRLINRVLQDDFNLSGPIPGRPLIEIFRIPELQDLVARVGDTMTETHIQLRTSQGEQRTFHTHATLYRNSQGVPQGTILVFHDLTRLKRLENLRQEFVANVSHELRTPLSMIKGCVETLLHGAKDDPAARDRFLQIIERHSDRLTFLIEDLLILSQLESGRVEFNFQPLDLALLVKRVLDDLSVKAAQHRVALDNQVPADIAVHADANRLQQVFFNLVENAIKYGRGDGKVTVGTSPGGENQVTVWVKDDGPGLPPEAVGRVFERFYRADKARSREQGGTGLGLAIVKHIVQAHHGRVWVESQLGQGATFYFTLPRRDPGLTNKTPV